MTLFLLLALSAQAAGPVAVSGVIQSIDDGGHAELRLQDGSTLTARLAKGEQAYLKAGDHIRAQRVQVAGDVMLETVWPNDPKKEAQMVAINARLRRDTEVRGRQAYRSIGEDLPPFALYNQFGELVKSSDLKGKVCVINFIFTRCMNPRMCPAATTRMQKLQEKVEEAGLEDQVLFVSMTLDPEFDTPGIFNTYAANRGIDGTNFYFLGGPTDALVDLKKQLGILTSKDPKVIIDHTMRTILVDPSGEIVYQVPGSIWGQDDFLNRINRLLENEENGGGQ